TDDLEFFHVEESDVFDTLSLLNGTTTVGYSHRGGGRAPTDDLEFFHVEESDVFDTLSLLNGTTTVGYSHR
ncbi:hypothetical protein CQA15_29665, partial [Klebsiella pneumoniae]|uniref:hypothetical protein n=1 Tax=Klebsiella pneumoniae TaxID=573 RepID=UPI000BD6BF78